MSGTFAPPHVQSSTRRHMSRTSQTVTKPGQQEDAQRPSPAATALLRRLPWIPLTISAAVVLFGLSAVPPIRDAATLGQVPEVYLVRSLGYIALSPISSVLDTLTLLSSHQHIALLTGAILLFAAVRSWRTARGLANWKQNLRALGVLLATIVATYAAAAFLPRPMAALGAGNSNIVRVDFHSHTTASHDGHQSVEQLREWHRLAGFDVVFVTDHGAVSAAERGIAANPPLAGGGVTALQGIEVTWSGEHVSILGAQRVYKGILTDNLRDVDEQGLQLASMVRGREPVVIWNHPRQLDRLKPAQGAGTSGVRAVEIVNGSPKDMTTVRRNRGKIVTFAETANLALTSGSDNHGFGRTAPGWTLMLIVGWRGAGSDALALEIDRVLRDGGYRATKVVERRVADPGASKALLALTVVAAPIDMLRTLSVDERVAWLLWTWLISAAVWAAGRRRHATPPR
jgi:hypothetical protein